MNKTCAKLHAILSRKGNKAVVFRRGPSSCVAVIGCDFRKDTFTIGQWLRGRKIKKLSGNFFDTNDVKLEFSPGNPDTLYCYYVSERYNNFMTGFVR